MYILNKELKVKLPDAKYVFKKGTPCKLVAYNSYSRSVTIVLPGIDRKEIVCTVKKENVEVKNEKV